MSYLNYIIKEVKENNFPNLENSLVLFLNNEIEEKELFEIALNTGLISEKNFIKKQKIDKYF